MKNVCGKSVENGTKTRAFAPAPRLALGAFSYIRLTCGRSAVRTRQCPPCKTVLFRTVFLFSKMFSWWIGKLSYSCRGRGVRRWRCRRGGSRYRSVGKGRLILYKRKSTVFRKKYSTFSWCGWGDLNPHVLANTST